MSTERFVKLGVVHDSCGTMMSLLALMSMMSLQVPCQRTISNKQAAKPGLGISFIQRGPIVAAKISVGGPILAAKM